MKRCLVTGGTGFIGINLVRRLLSEGHQVTLLLRPNHSTWRLDGIEKEVQIHEINLENYAALQQFLSRLCPDWIFNLAAHGAYSWQTDATPIIASNFSGTVALLDAAAQTGFEAFVQAGSSSEYGAKDHAPTEEELPEPNSLYATTKNAATNYCHFIGKSQNLPVVTLRLYSIYGPYEDSQRLIPSMIRKGLEGSFPTLTNPDTARDFVHTEDCVKAFILAASKASLNCGEVFNIGSGTQTTLRQVVEIFSELLFISERPEWGTMPNRVWDTTCWQSDPSKAQNKLGWSPSIKLKLGIQKTLEAYQKMLPHR